MSSRCTTRILTWSRAEILAVVGDNGAGKSTLIKALSGATIPDAGEIYLEGRSVQFSNPLAARLAGIETVYQELAVATQLDIAQNMFWDARSESLAHSASPSVSWTRGACGRRRRSICRRLEFAFSPSGRPWKHCRADSARRSLSPAPLLGAARSSSSTSRPPRSGFSETNQVLEPSGAVRDHGLSVVLISHSMPEVFEIADRIHIHRLGRRAVVVSPRTTEMSEVVAVMTGALRPEQVASALPTQPRAVQQS